MDKDIGKVLFTQEEEIDADNDTYKEMIAWK